MARVILELGEDNQHLFVVRGTQYHGEEKAITLGGADHYMYMSIPEEMIDGYWLIFVNWASNYITYYEVCIFSKQNLHSL